MAWLPSRSLAAFLTFTAGSLLILLLVVNRYLLPAMRAASGADERARSHLAAISALVLAIVLVILIGFAILVLRPGRFFLPRNKAPRTRTVYTDAWAESAQRQPTPPPDSLE